MNKIHFSVVTVVKNDLLGLKKTRRSLETQKYHNWTHIIIDGGSKKDTIKYIRSLSSVNTIWISEADSGIYSAMNKAWKLAPPESYVYYLNAKDIFVGDKSLYEAARALKAENYPLWGCSTHEEIREDGQGWVCKLVSPPSIQNQLYAFGYRSHQAVVMKSKLIADLGGFDESYQIASDWDLITKALMSSEPAIWVRPLGRFELGGKSQGNLLIAHLELMQIRKKVLPQTIKQKFFDSIWCAVYLRMFGYKNAFSPFVELLYKKRVRKVRTKKRKLKRKSFPKMIIWIWTIGIEISLTKRSLVRAKSKSWISGRHIFVKIFTDLRWRLVAQIQKELLIKPYEAPKDRTL